MANYTEYKSRYEEVSQEVNNYLRITYPNQQWRVSLEPAVYGLDVSTVGSVYDDVEAVDDSAVIQLVWKQPGCGD